VSIPRGGDRLPKDISSGSQAAADTDVASHLVEASQRGITRAAGPDVLTRKDSNAAAATPARDGARVLVADDNADMREYLVRLLSPRWAVEAVEDGEAALDAALRHPPDLVLSDVMMPRMDGVALLQALRADPRTSSIPVVLLSARAGEEAVVGGLDTGADDYLVKPFSARELISRVGTHVEMARVRRTAAETLKELAETRAALLADLKQKNKELEAFSYSVSHDLRAPLRSIAGFSQALLEDCADQLDAKGADYLRRVRAAGQRMGELIDDLLQLSRVGRAELLCRRVDLSEIARTVVSELQKREPERRVAVEIEEGLTVNADGRLMRVALDNLIGNAWKFTANAAQPRVELRSERAGKGPVFFVRDNGAGFDMAHVEKLFRPFQRLHAASEFPGTGIGLATVHRIVDRHGGRVWAKSEVGQGATIYFAIPEQSADHS
jgi:signal transduction histidine kinase